MSGHTFFDDRKFEVVERVRARLEKAAATFDGIDGVRITTTDGWWLLRASNTQAVLVARAEAGLKRLKASLRGHLEASSVIVPAEMI